MNKNVQSLLDELRGKLSGYAVMLYYRYSNLCVKAEPIALLSLSIEDEEGDEKDFEEVAGAMQPNPYQLQIVPKAPQLLYNLCKGVMAVHPEFKQEIITPAEEDRQYPDQNEEQHLLLTAPEVNEDRHDVLMDGVSTLYDACKLQMDTNRDAFKVKMTTMLAGHDQKDIDEAEDNLEQTYNEHMKMVDEYRANKEKEIEDAYQKYLAKQAAKAKKQREMDEARGGENIGRSFRMGMTDDE